MVPDIGDPSVNGVTFDEDFGGAVQSIYDGTASATGTPTDVAFSSEGAIAVWTLMNVNNPDFSVLLQEVEEDRRVPTQRGPGRHRRPARRLDVGQL